MEIEELLQTYPRKRDKLPKQYQRIYTKHYKENRDGKTRISSLSRRMEYWMHRKTAESSSPEKKTLELGGGYFKSVGF